MLYNLKKNLFIQIEKEKKKLLIFYNYRTLTGFFFFYKTSIFQITVYRGHLYISNHHL